MKAKYGWIIDRDHLAEQGIGDTDVATMGPRNLSPEYKNGLSQGFGTKFKMYDDDGELYYEGRIVGSFDGMEPLDDFGMPNAGCTMIEVQLPDGTFSRL